MSKSPFADTQIGNLKSPGWELCITQPSRTSPSHGNVVVIDGLSMRTLGFDVVLNRSTERVISLLDKLVQSHGCPVALEVDFGQDVPRERLSKWCIAQGIELRTIVPRRRSVNRSVDKTAR